MPKDIIDPIIARIDALEDQLSWLSYNPKDKNTWPEKQAKYLIRMIKLFHSEEVFIGHWLNNYPWENTVTAYLKIPEYAPTTRGNESQGSQCLQIKLSPLQPQS